MKTKADRSHDNVKVAFVASRGPRQRWRCDGSSTTIAFRIGSFLVAVAISAFLWTKLGTFLLVPSSVPFLSFRHENVAHKKPAASHGAVVSESALCSRHGADMMTMGGNAADAMVATSFCVGVVAMYHSGIGGGGFVLVKDASGSFEFVDFRETAPGLSDVDMFSHADSSYRPGLKSGVPGELKGLEYIHKKYGSLPWSTVMMPAIKLAREGFPVTRDLLDYMEIAVEEVGHDFLHGDSSWSVDFAPGGTRLGLGDRMTRKRYADTLEQIALHGSDKFYSGQLGRQFVDAVTVHGGIMTMDDLANYSVRVRNHSEIGYRDFRVITGTAPSGGIVVANILKVVDSYDDFFTAKNVNLSTHRLDEAIRFAHGLRSKLGDPDFVEGMQEYQDFMLRASTVERIRGRISDGQTHKVSEYNPDGIESIETHGTSHFATVDSSGLAISATTSINRLFGSRVIVPENGIIVNNEMDDFSTPNKSKSFGYFPSRANYILGGKRPLSAMAPSMVLHANGTLFMIAGAAGGSLITTTTVQTMVAAMDEGLSASSVLARPRFHDQLMPDHVTFERAYDKGTVEFMRGLGHRVVFMAPTAGSKAHTILISSDGGFDAAAEPRQADSGSVVV